LFLAKPTDKAALNEKPFMAIPASAIKERDGKKIAFRVNDNSASGVPVLTGRQLGGMVEVVQGLSLGEKVIDPLGDEIDDGVKVTVSK